VITMRLIGTVNVDGKRVALDWKVNGISVQAGPGLSADDVKVITNLPALEEAPLGGTAPIKPIETNSWDALTVTELRVELTKRDLPPNGKKADLIARLIEADSDTEEVVVEEVGEDESADSAE